MAKVRTVFWIELVLASFSGFLAALTVFWDDWIEALTGYDPDQHDGTVEWEIVLGLVFVCVLFSIAARSEWRRAHSTAAANI